MINFGDPGNNFGDSDLDYYGPGLCDDDEDEDCFDDDCEDKDE